MSADLYRCPTCGANLSLDQLRGTDCPFCKTVFPHHARAVEQAQMVNLVMAQQQQQAMGAAQAHLASYGLAPAPGPPPPPNPYGAPPYATAAVYGAPPMAYGARPGGPQLPGYGSNVDPYYGANVANAAVGAAGRTMLYVLLAIAGIAFLLTFVGGFVALFVFRR